METCTNKEIGVQHADKHVSNTTNINQETSSNNIGPINSSEQHSNITNTSANHLCHSATIDNKPNMNGRKEAVKLQQSAHVKDTKINQSVEVDSKHDEDSEMRTIQAQSSLSQLLEYGLTDSDESDSESRDNDTDSEMTTDAVDENNTSNMNNRTQSTEFRNNSSDSSSSSSEYESDSSSSCSDIGACAVTPVAEKQNSKGKVTPLRTRGELGMDDLPPIEDLKISVPEEECLHMGTISSIIDQLVIVQSLPGLPAYDIDTLLFLNQGKQTLGKVFDVLGPVTEPYYAVRFNSYEQAIEIGAKPGVPVYCAPARHASYVFVSELMKIKGSDASWEHNNEPPVMFLDFSDDEEERQARRAMRNRGNISSDSHKSNSLERNKKFEKQMNDKNLLMNEHFNRSQSSGVGRKLGGEPRVPCGTLGVGHVAAVRAPPPTGAPAWAVPRPDLWPGPAYQFGYQYRPMPVFPNVGVGGPRAAFAPAPTVFHAPAMPFNPAVPPPMLAPHPLPFHPRWVAPPIGVLPPRPNLDHHHSPYTQ